jgi:Zinc finger C-x8-C-x5-C-x3-H type (and similar)
MVDIMMDDMPDFSFEFENAMDKRDFMDTTTNGPSASAPDGPRDEYTQKPGEICKFYLKGSCMKGAQCMYRHSRNERAVVCKHWLRGLCKKGDLCEFLHEYDLEKMPECYFFSKFGMYCYFATLILNKKTFQLHKSNMGNRERAIHFNNKQIITK